MENLFFRAGSRYGFEQSIDDLVDGNAFGFGPVTDKNAVPQGRVYERPQVVDRHVGAALKQCPHFGA